MVMPPSGGGPRRESDPRMNVQRVAVGDLPADRLVATHQTSESKAIRLKLEDGIVAADAAQQLL